MKKAENIIPIVLLTVAGLLVLYSTWAFIHCRNYIADAIASGQLETSGNEYDIVNFFMSNCVQYIIYAVILFSISWLLRSRSVIVYQVPSSEGMQSNAMINQDDELDEWFIKMKESKED